MAEREEKYIVIKLKDLGDHEGFVDFRGFPSGDRGDYRNTPEAWAEMERDLKGFKEVLLALDNQNKYLVVNLDEPYAESFYDILIAFETLKESVAKQVDSGQEE